MERSLGTRVIWREGLEAPGDEAAEEEEEGEAAPEPEPGLVVVAPPGGTPALEAWMEEAVPLVDRRSLGTCQHRTNAAISKPLSYQAGQVWQKITGVVKI